MSYQDIINDKIIKCPGLYKINNGHTRDNFDLSSEEDGSKSQTKKFEKIFNQNFETDWNTYLINNKIIKEKGIYKNYKITSFNFFIKNNKNQSDNSINKINNKINKKSYKDTKKRGRKRKREETDDNDKKILNKFSDDNLRKKCKNIALKFILEFLTEK